MNANPWRGEVEIELDNKLHVLCPTFEALNQIEQELNTGLIALARKLSDGHLTLEELATIIFCTAKKSAEFPSKDILQKTILCNGLRHSIESVSTLMARIFEGFYEQNK